VTENEFPRSKDPLISNRAFWLGLALYAALLVAATAAFGGTVPETETGFAWKASPTGTLIFGIREQPETDALYANHRIFQGYETPGQLTLRSYLTFGFTTRFNQPRLNNSLTARALDPRIADLTSARTIAPSVNGPVVSGDGGPAVTPMQIALGTQSSFIAEDLTATPEPATWFAAVLAAGTVAWSQRRRFARSFFGTRIVMSVAGACLVIVSSASTTLSEELPQTGERDCAARFSPPDGGSIDQAAYPFGLEDDVSEAFNNFGRASASQSIGSLTTVNLRKNQNLTISGAPGATVVLSLKSFLMSGSSTFTLQGTATTSFVINVNKQFSLSGMAKIMLSGDVQWNNVVFNVRGQGSVVTLSGHSSLTGILNANDRTVKMSGQAIVYGKVNAKKLRLLESSQIIEPPVVSPEQPPTP